MSKNEFYAYIAAQSVGCIFIGYGMQSISIGYGLFVILISFSIFLAMLIQGMDD